MKTLIIKTVVKKVKTVSLLLIFSFLFISFACAGSELVLEEQETRNTAFSLSKTGRNDMANKKGTYQDFLNALRTFETTIDPADAAFYSENYLNPNAVQYQKVEYPGRVIRDINGNPEVETTSVKRYFEKLGIDHLYTQGSSDPNMFHTMQYAVVNFIGFVGYQFSEQDLWVLGYYEHYDEQGLPEFYSDESNSTWSNGVRDVIVFEKEKYGAWLHITDVNRWTGKFTGLHGIYTMADFMDPTKQDFVAEDHFQFKYDNIVSGLTPYKKQISDFIGTKLYWNECIPPVSPPPGGRSNEVTVSMSGLLAGAHLRGAAGVVDLLINHKNNADEIGTTILQYVQDFGGYDTPYGENRKYDVNTSSPVISENFKK